MWRISVVLSADMDSPSNKPSNEGENVVPLRRRPGPPKGTPRPEGAGRKKGVPNRITRDVKEIALKDAPAMLRGLKRLAESAVDERTRLAATIAYLDRAYGRPVQATEITGKDGAPLNGEEREMSEIETGRRIAFMMNRASHAILGRPPDPRLEY